VIAVEFDRLIAFRYDLTTPRGFHLWPDNWRLDPIVRSFGRRNASHCGWKSRCLGGRRRSIFALSEVRVFLLAGRDKLRGNRR
jgi:hypothetical protein